MVSRAKEEVVFSERKGCGETRHGAWVRLYVPSLLRQLKRLRQICSEAPLRVFSSGERCESTQDGHLAILLLTAGAGFDWLG